MIEFFRYILESLVGPERPERPKGLQQDPEYLRTGHGQQVPSHSASKSWGAGLNRDAKTHIINNYLEHSQNPHYISLRSKADDASLQMGELFRQSHLAYEAGPGNGAEAKRLSDEAKALRAEKDRLNREAADWIFEQNNKLRGLEEMDLHGLRAEEAVEKTESRIIEARRCKLPELRIIVGKGLHSRNHESVLKPRIQELMHKHDLVVEVDPQNGGVLIIHFGKRTAGRDTDNISSEEIGERCIVM